MQGVREALAAAELRTAGGRGGRHGDPYTVRQLTRINIPADDPAVAQVGGMALPCSDKLMPAWRRWFRCQPAWMTLGSVVCLQDMRHPAIHPAGSLRQCNCPRL